MSVEFGEQLPLWREFAEAAGARRQDPLHLLQQYMQECLESWQDEALDEEIRAELTPTGYTEEDAVELVRSLRRAPQ